MIKILFVCHGNICRSPMAEFVMKDMVKKQGMADEFYIASAATSTEEIGNGVHHGTRKKLASVGIGVDGKTAVQLKKSDYDKYDYILGMDSWNMRNMKRMLPEDKENKIHLLLDFSDEPQTLGIRVILMQRIMMLLKVAKHYLKRYRKSVSDALFLFDFLRKNWQKALILERFLGIIE